MDDDIIVVKRVRASSALAYNYPVLKMLLPSGRFFLNKKAIEALGVENNGGIMFIFNRKTRAAYIVLDSDPGAFIIRKKLNEDCYRFCSKDLSRHFKEVFRLDDGSRESIVFHVADQPNEKGWFALTLSYDV